MLKALSWKGLLACCTLLSALVALSGCGEIKTCEPATLTVERVFWHMGNNYSFMVKEPDGQMYIRAYPISGKYNSSQAEVSLVADVPKGAPMRLELSKCVWEGSDDGHSRFEKAVIHIHAPDDVNGADWKQGKNGRGATIPIQ